jgi:hypothetical protein
VANENVVVLALEIYFAFRVYHVNLIDFLLELDDL